MFRYQYKLKQIKNTICTFQARKPYLIEGCNRELMRKTTAKRQVFKINIIIIKLKQVQNFFDTEFIFKSGNNTESQDEIFQ